MAGVYKSIFTGPEIDAKLSERVPSTPSGSPLHDLFVAAGAVWDTSSKSWTVGSVTGISNSVMTKIYSLSHNVLNNSNWDSALYSVSIPVNLPPRKSPNQYIGDVINVSANATFANSNMQEIHICPAENRVVFGKCNRAFANCKQLKEVVGIMVFEQGAFDYTFANCSNLQNIQIKYARYDIRLADSPLLTLESFQYLVENATNTSAITVTVHADVYAKLTDPQQADWYAVNTAAQGKQISFATA